MSDLDKYTDQIPEYLNGKLTAPEIEEFESALSGSEELQRAVAEMKQLDSGLNLYDQISEGHIDSELLAIYASGSEGISDSDISKVKAHVAECEECREELQICKPQPDHGLAQDEQGGLFKSIRDWLFASGSIVRPLAGIAVLVVMATSVFYYGQQESGFGNQVAAFDVIPSSSRGVGPTNQIVLPAETEIVTLSFRIAGQSINKYTFELNNSGGEAVFTLENLSFEDQFDIDIPSQYFTDGKFVLKVKEVAAGNEPVEIDHINLEVTLQE